MNPQDRPTTKSLVNSIGKLGIGESPGSVQTRGGDTVPEGYDIGRLKQFTPEQIQLFQQMLGHLAPDSFLSRLAGGDQSAFGEMEAPALNQFNELLGGISSRFSGGSGRGSLGNRHSSGFQNTTTAAANNFAQQLQSRRQELMSQSLQQLMSYSQMLLGQRPEEKAFFGQQQDQGTALGGAGPILGAAGGAAIGYLGGDPFTGAQIGAQAFSGL